MQLIRVPRIPRGALKVGSPQALAGENSSSQAFIHNGIVYDRVTRSDGKTAAFRVIQERKVKNADSCH